MSNSKFKIGQMVSYVLSTSTKRARKGGVIIDVEKLADGYVYTTKSIQPQGYVADVAIIDERNLVLSTRQNILNSYI
jgi:acyl CoA:acetate/3-ketoacid CoA transferase